MAASKQIRPVLAGALGNTLEWYDFALYGYFAPVIAREFFPSSDPLASLLSTFAVFAAGYLTRPLGGILLGHVADCRGRGAALRLSIMLMALPTFLMGLLPTHSQVGLASPAMLVILRLFQGCSVGGEFTTSISYLAEVAVPGRRYLTCSWASVGAILGMMMGSGAGALASTALPVEWGWRIPFLMGLALGAVGLYLRRGFPESVSETSVHPWRVVWRSHRFVVGRLILTNWAFTTGYYTVFLYLSTYLSSEGRLTQAQALRWNTLALLMLALLTPLAGCLCDRISGRRVAATAFAALVLLAVPLFGLMENGGQEVDFACQMIFVAVFALLEGSMPGVMASAFPRQVRATGIALCYNSATAIFGGTTPWVATAAIARTGNKLAPSFYLSLVALISLTALLATPLQGEAPDELVDLASGD